MAEKNKTYRLGKVANEFNIGVERIVEFLSKHGFEMEAKLNKKLEPEMYDLIAKEFSKEKPKETVRPEPIKKEPKSIKDIGLDKHEQIDHDETLVIKVPSGVSDTNRTVLNNINVSSKKVSSEKEDSAKKTPEDTSDFKYIDSKKPKIIGSIDLNKIDKPTEPTKEDSAKKVPEDTGDFKYIDSKKPKIVGSIDLDKINKPTEPTKEDSAKKEDEKIEDKKVEDKKIEEKEIEKKEPKIEEKKVEDKKAAKTSVLKEEKEIEKKKPEKEEKEVEDKKITKSEKKEKESDKTDENFIETKYINLPGVTITGTIDLDSLNNDKVNKKPKKARKRIKKDTKTTTNKGQKLDNKKDNINNNNNINKAKPRPKRTTNKRKGKPIEFTEEDIRKNISETLKILEHKERSKSVRRRKIKRKEYDDEVRKQLAQKEAQKNTIKVTEFVTVNDLAALMNVDVAKVIQTCMNLGLIVTMNQRLDAETMAIVADEFDYEIDFTTEINIDDYIEEPEENEEDLVPRTPIVTVMGHVDHGKTSLLDYIRNANVIAGEAGGITQHIGAYEVTLSSGKKITFLDTPGHEAFTAMRARGAQITDIAIIVIAADDKVMPQTIEAINHAQAAGVPIVFAINKIDKPTANPNKIKEELANIKILVEDWGGSYQSQEISAKKGINVDTLLEKVLLEAELLDLKGNPNKRAEGTVIESSLDKGRGYIAKILVRDGTLHKGDVVLAGTYYGKVKALFNERNQNTDNCGPSTPVLMLGLNGAPPAGEKFIVFEDEKEAKLLAGKREQLEREIGIRTQKHITLDEIGRRIAIGDFQELNIILKADVDGSLEAISESLLKLSTEEVQVNVIHESVGQITDNDIMLASASDAIIIGFQVRPSNSAKKLAEQEQIDIRTYSVIYQAIEEVKDAIEGMLVPEIKEKVTCNLEVKEIFNISKVGTIAGCMVQNGVITRNTKVRLIRDGIVVHTGKLGSLKRFKDDVKEVKTGYECGLNLDNFNDIQVGDIIEGYEKVEIQRKL
jgi:translation initiation factor IF-2